MSTITNEPVLDSLAPSTPGLWSFGHVTVERVESGPISLDRRAVASTSGTPSLPPI